MSKLLYVLLILPLFLNSLHAFYPDGEEEREGKVFRSQICVVKKEKDAADHIRWSPKEATLTAATIRHLNNRALLHYKYSERMSNGDNVFSFTATPNRTGLTKESTTFEGLSQTAYASIPVRFSGDSRKIELLIFEENSASTNADYAETIAASLELLLTEYLPSCSADIHPDTIIHITDSSRALQDECLRGRLKWPIESKYIITTVNPLQEGVDYWELFLHLKE